MRTFPKLQRKRLPERAADEIEDAIVAGDFPAGSQLPSEQQLADQFQVSRNVMREAFKYLLARGLIMIVNGSGAYVCHPSGAPTSSALHRYIRLLGAHQSIGALYEARRILEGENARLAALRATDADIQHLEHCLQRMTEGADRVEAWSEADLDFHIGVASATHNPFLIVLLEPLVNQLRDVISEGYRVPGAAERGLAAHSQLLSAIRARDTEAAYRAIMDHLSDSEARLEPGKVTSVD